MNINQIVESVVEHDLRVKDHNHVYAAEHLEHFLVQQEIHRGNRLRVGTCEIKDRLVADAPQGALYLVWPHAHTVIANIVFKVLLGSRH